MADVVKEVVFKDFDLRFKNHPITGKLITRKNAESIKQALQNLIRTNLGERPYRPLFGSKVTASLFETITPETIAIIKRSVEDAINNYETRVQLINVVVATTSDENTIQISIYFRPINGREVLQTTVTLERSR